MIFKGKADPQGMHDHSEHVIGLDGRVVAIFRDARLETKDPGLIEQLKQLGYEEAPPDPPPYVAPDTFVVLEVPRKPAPVRVELEDGRWMVDGVVESPQDTKPVVESPVLTPEVTPEVTEKKKRGKK